MAANKRTAAQIKADRVTIARLYVKGLLHREIADSINQDRPAAQHITREMVTREIKTLVAEWQASVSSDVAQVLAVQLRRLAWIEGEAEDAWERSKLDAQERQRTNIQEGAPVLDSKKQVQFDKTGEVILETRRTASTIKQKGQVGDARHLELILECWDKRCKIFGLYAPEKIQVNDLDALIEKELRRLKGEQVTNSEASQ